MIRWPRAFFDILAQRDLKVIGFDNGDVGLSEKIGSGGVPDLAKIVSVLISGQTPEVPYLLDDIAADAEGLMDALEIGRAHIVGVSLGGRGWSPRIIPIGSCL